MYIDCIHLSLNIILVISIQCINKAVHILPPTELSIYHLYWFNSTKLVLYNLSIYTVYKLTVQFTCPI